MDGRSFLGLKSTESPTRWVPPVAPGLCSGRSSLYGGVGIAAGVAALGDRSFPHSGQFVAMPPVPRPSESRVRIRLDQDEPLSGRVEQRPVKFRPGETLDGTVPTEWVLLDIHI